MWLEQSIPDSIDLTKIMLLLVLFANFKEHELTFDSMIWPKKKSQIHNKLQTKDLKSRKL